MRTIRKATETELAEPIETVKYSLIERYCKLIENRNIKDTGKSICFSSMDLPNGIIALNYSNEDKVDIHKGWREILWNSYRLNINPILVEVA